MFTLLLQKLVLRLSLIKFVNIIIALALRRDQVECKTGEDHFRFHVLILTRQRARVVVTSNIEKLAVDQNRIPIN